MSLSSGQVFILFFVRPHTPYHLAFGIDAELHPKLQDRCVALLAKFVELRDRIEAARNLHIASMIHPTPFVVFHHDNPRVSWVGDFVVFWGDIGFFVGEKEAFFAGAEEEVGMFRDELGTVSVT